MPKTYLIVDGTNTFIRNFCIVPSIDSSGNSIGGVVGFLKSLNLFVKLTRPTDIIIVFDGPGGSQRRRTLFKDYKSQRKIAKLKRNYEHELDNVKDNKIYQILKLRKYLQSLPVSVIEIENIEADDTIAYLVSFLEGDKKVIVSTDKDFYQLLTSETIIYSPSLKKFINSRTCFDIFNINSKNFALAKSIVGDKSDNIPGIRGVGFKTAIKLFPFLGDDIKYSVSDLISFCKKQNDKKYDKFISNEETLIRNYKLVQLESSIISMYSSGKIKNELNQKNKFNLTELRKDLIRDGINIEEDLFMSFRPFLLQESK